MQESLSNIIAVSVIFLFAIKEFFAWIKSRKNGNGNGYSLKALEVINTSLKEIGNENHHEVTVKLDELIKVNNEQLYILKDVKDLLKDGK